MKIEDVSNIWKKIRKFKTKKGYRSSDDNLFAFLEYVTYLVQELTHAEGARLYLLNEKQDELILKIFHHKNTDSTRTVMISSLTNEEKVSQMDPNIKLILRNGQKNRQHVVALSAHDNKIINISDIQDKNDLSLKDLDFSDIKVHDEFLNYQTRSLLVIPINDHLGELTGVFQLFNANEGNDVSTVRGFTREDVTYTEIISAIIGITASNYALNYDMEKLFESFVKVLATAIDEKSAYTGHHCRRVPILALMIADSLGQVQEGPFKDYKLSEADRYELELAALLHDAGKISTPPHIMDKSTKLEKIFDRIELINTRFEIILRDFELAFHREKGQTPQDKWPELKEKYQKLVDQCKKDRRFLRDCNLGQEEMPLSSKEKIYEISNKYKWRNSKGEIVSCLTEDEVKNLCVIHGTLTKEERDIINHHALTTINMLDKMHFPKHLQRIPEIAVNHHEKMDGTGYPRGLKQDEMSVEARLMGVADVFEALTAKDRPYKKGKTLSEALKIMGKMRENHHIDGDIFDVFLEKRVYLDYARSHLDDYQIDTVVLEDIPGYRSKDFSKNSDKIRKKAA